MESSTFPFPVREFPDRGAKWLLSHPPHLYHIIRMLLGEAADQIDFDHLQPFPTESLSEELRKQLADLVFIAPLREPPEAEATLFILVEHQSTPVRAMTFRALFYMMQLWDTQRRGWERDQVPESQWSFRPVIPLVFYTGSARWDHPLGLEELMSLPAVLSCFVPRFELLFLNLKATPPEQLTDRESAFGHLLRLMQQEDAPREPFQRLLEEVISQVETLTAQDQDAWTRILHYLLLLIYHRRGPEERLQLETVVTTHHRDRSRREEIEKMSKTIAQQLIEEGEARGEARGEAHGRQLMLLNLLRAKFGDLPTAVEQRVQRLSVDELDRLAGQLIQAESLDELDF